MRRMLTQNLLPFLVELALLGTVAAPITTEAAEDYPWHVRSSEVTNRLLGIAYSPELKQYLVVGDETILASEDARTWFIPVAHPNGGTSVVWGQDRYFTTGWGGEIGRSLDGVRWLYVGLFFARSPWANAIAYDPNRNLLVAAGGGFEGAFTYSVIWASTNGLDWGYGIRLEEGMSPPILYDVTFGQAQLVVVGGVPGSSVNLIAAGPTPHQLLRSSARSKDGRLPCLYGVASGSGMFVVVGESGSIFTSANLEEWEPQESGTIHNLKSVTYGQGRFVAVGHQGTILSSVNGTNWVAHGGTTANNLNRVIHANGRFLAVGDNGTILESSRVPRMLHPQMLQNGEFTFGIEPGDWTGYSLEASADLVNWTSLMEFEGSEPVTAFVDEAASVFRFRFYRIVAP